MFFKELFNNYEIKNSDWDKVVDKKKNNEELICIQRNNILDEIYSLIYHSTKGDAYDKVMKIKGMLANSYDEIYDYAMSLDKSKEVKLK